MDLMTLHEVIFKIQIKREKLIQEPVLEDIPSKHAVKT